MIFSWFKLVPKSLDGMMVGFDMSWTRISYHLPHAFAMTWTVSNFLATEAFRGPVVFSCWMKCSNGIFMSHTLLGAGAGTWGWPCNRVRLLILFQFLHLARPFPTYFCNRKSCNRAIFERSYVRNVVNPYFGPSGPCFFTCAYRFDGWGMMRHVISSTTQWPKCFPWALCSLVVKLIGTPCPPDVEPSPLPQQRKGNKEHRFFSECVASSIHLIKGDPLKGIHSRGHIQSRCGCLSKQPGHPSGILNLHR